MVEKQSMRNSNARQVIIERSHVEHYATVSCYNLTTKVQYPELLAPMLKNLLLKENKSAVEKKIKINCVCSTVVL